MKNRISLKSLMAILAASVVLFATTSCQKDDAEKAPVLPPESSMVMDFSDFADTKSAATASYFNRSLAVVHASVWNAVIFVHMAVPVATFREAFNHDPVQQEDGKWKWSYSVNAGNDTYTASLFAELDGASVNWEMYVSKTGAFAFEDFLWYTGNSLLNGKSGTWILNHSVGNAQPYVGIEWSKNEDETFAISYTNIVPGGSENGGYISHGRTGDAAFDAFYEIFNKGENNLVTINWNTETKAGQISDPKIFGNTDFHCWAADGTDTVCE